MPIAIAYRLARIGKQPIAWNIKLCSAVIGMYIGGEFGR